MATQEKVGGWVALGDVHATLQSEFALRAEGVCPSHRTFNSLRTALIAGGFAREIVRLETELDVFAAGRPKRFLSQLGKATELEMPICRLALPGKIGAGLFYSAFIASIVFGLNGQWQVALWLLLPLTIGIILLWADKGRWPPGVTTIGDIAAQVAALNHSRLGDVRDLPDTLWQRLTAIVAQQSDLPRQAMRADTLLFAPRKGVKTG